MPVSGQALLELMQAVLAKGASFRFRARGWSMMPIIRDGDVITVAPQAQPLPGIGDVVAFVRPSSGHLVVHRVVAREEAAVWIQGDSAADQPDELVPLGNLLGRVVRIERKGHSTWIGLGPERFLIAWLSRASFLTPLRVWLAQSLKRFS